MITDLSFLEVAGPFLAMTRQLRRSGVPDDLLLKALVSVAAFEAADQERPLNEIIDMLTATYEAAQTEKVATG